MRRTFWLAAGFGLGLYAGERVRRTVVKLTPETFGDTVRSMVSDAIEAGKVRDVASGSAACVRPSPRRRACVRAGPGCVWRADPPGASTTRAVA